MTTVLAPVARQLFLNPSNGAPASGFKLFTYAAGTTTKLATYTDASGGTPNTNPIIMDSLGECGLWLTPGLAYKFVFSPPTDTDPPTNPIWTVDNITWTGGPTSATIPETSGGETVYFGWVGIVTAVSAVVPESIIYLRMTSALGSANPITANKSCLRSDTFVNNGSAGGWATAMVTTMGAGGAIRNGIVHEADLNNNWGDYPTTPSFPYAANHVCTGNVGHINNACYLADIEGGTFAHGAFVAQGGSTPFDVGAFVDLSSGTPQSFVGAGTHTFGLNLSPGVYSSASILLPNAAPIAQQDSGGTQRNLIGLNASNLTVVGDTSHNILLNGPETQAGGPVQPTVDNSFNLGASSFRWATVYAGTGTINTSGKDTKANARGLSEEEMRAAKTIAANPKVYQFCDAVAKKGEQAARLHTGFIYEEVIAAFTAEGLDPSRYGIVCEDPAFKTVTVATPRQRQKRVPVTRWDYAVDLVDGVAKRRRVEETWQKPVFDEIPLHAEDGSAVMIPGEWLFQPNGDHVRNEKGEALRGDPRQKMHHVPVMEDDPDGPLITTERVPDLDETGKQKMIFGLRYSELMVFIMAGMAEPRVK